MPLSLYPAVTESHKCNFCGHSNEIRSNYLLNVVIDNIQYDGFTGLEATITNYLKSEAEKCPVCNRHTMTISVKLHDYMNIDTYFWCEMQNYTCNLTEILIRIQAQNQFYELVGAVEQRRSHYVSYCRSLNNLWDKRDDQPENLTELGKIIYPSF